MDARGARHLVARLAVGAAPGERVEVVSVGDGEGGEAAVQPGETGTVVAIGEDEARILFDSGLELTLDPSVVRLRRRRRGA
jgi:hypothetical protein